MRTVETKVYTFNELSESAKETAIENVRESYYNWNDFANWAVDDCALFEPQEKELVELFGTEYNFPLLKNNRKNIYFDTDRNSFLDIEDAIEVTNNEQFLMWLGIDVNINGLEDICFTIFTPKGRNSDTTIDFDNYSSDFDNLIVEATTKFEDLISDILERIEKDIDYRFTDEAIIDDIEANEYEFTEEGNIY